MLGNICSKNAFAFELACILGRNIKCSVIIIIITYLFGICIHRQPDVPCFATPVKAKRILLKAQRHSVKVNFNMANIYVGKGTSASDIYLGI